MISLGAVLLAGFALWAANGLMEIHDQRKHKDLSDAEYFKKRLSEDSWKGPFD